MTRGAMKPAVFAVIGSFLFSVQKWFHRVASYGLQIGRENSNSMRFRVSYLRVVPGIPYTFSSYTPLPALSITVPYIYRHTESEAQRGHYITQSHTATQYKNPDLIPVKVAECVPTAF